MSSLIASQAERPTFPSQVLGASTQSADKQCCYGYTSMTKQQFLDTVITPYKEHIAYGENANHMVSLKYNFFRDHTLPGSSRCTAPIVSFDWQPPKLEESLYNTIDDETPSTELQGPCSCPVIVCLTPTNTNEIKFVYLGFNSRGNYYPETPLEFTDKFDNVSNRFIQLSTCGYADGEHPVIPSAMDLCYNLPDGVYHNVLPGGKIVKAIFKGGACQGAINMFEDIAATYNIVNGQLLQYDSDTAMKYIDRRKREIIAYDNKGNIALSMEFDERHRPHGLRTGDMGNYSITYNHGIIHGPFTVKKASFTSKTTLSGYIDQGILPIDTVGITCEDFCYLIRCGDIIKYVVGTLTQEESYNNGKMVDEKVFSANHIQNGLQKIHYTATMTCKIPMSMGKGSLSKDELTVTRYWLDYEEQPKSSPLDPSKAESIEYTEDEYYNIFKHRNEIVDTVIRCMDVTKLIWSYIL